MIGEANGLSSISWSPHYNYYRDYDPSIGRYLQSDRSGLRGGLNTYLYVNGTPLKLVDPKGLVGFGVNDMRDMIARNNNSGYSNELILCIAWNESNFDPFLSSGTGPRGLMMVSNVALKELRRSGRGNYNPNDVDVDPEQNIGAGSAYLGWMRDRGKRRGTEDALRSYGTGPTYPAPQIIDCEKCLKEQPACADPKECLAKVHK